MREIKGIIFDMDNTLLRSTIDFEAMKQETFSFLVAHGILSTTLDLSRHTTSTLIEAAYQTGLMTEPLIAEMWDIPKRFEVAGMKDADLEPGVEDLLEALKDRYRLTIVTNNAIEAAHKALLANDILKYFDSVVGRESMRALKPSPDGFELVLRQYAADMTAEEWISVGDAWVDGMASSKAGIRFISYQADIAKMNKMGVYPTASIDDIRELKNYLG